jgi:hypothetical protein
VCSDALHHEPCAVHIDRIFAELRARSRHSPEIRSQGGFAMVKRSQASCRPLALAAQPCAVSLDRAEHQMSTRRTFASLAAALALSLSVLPTNAAVAAESLPLPFEAGAAVHAVQG